MTKMFAWIGRNRLRAQLSELLEGRLDTVAAARLRARVERDPVLAGEFALLSQARAALAAWPTAPVPQRLREDLDLDLALTDKPLRARYGELLDGRNDPRLRAAIAADDELAGEFALLETGLGLLRSQPPVAVPADFRLSLSRRLDALDDQRERTPVAAAAPRRGWAPRLAQVGASSLLLFGVMIGLGGYRPDSHRHRHSTVVTVAAPAQPAGRPAASAPPAQVATAPVVVHAEPSVPAAVAPVAVTRLPHVRQAAPSVPTAPRLDPPVATPVAPAPRRALTAVVPSAPAAGLTADEIPDPAVLNAVDSDTTPNILVFAADAPDEQF